MRRRKQQAGMRKDRRPCSSPRRRVAVARHDDVGGAANRRSRVGGCIVLRHPRLARVFRARTLLLLLRRIPARCAPRNVAGCLPHGAPAQRVPVAVAVVVVVVVAGRGLDGVSSIGLDLHDRAASYITLWCPLLHPLPWMHFEVTLKKRIMILLCVAPL